MLMCWRRFSAIWAFSSLACSGDSALWSSLRAAIWIDHVVDHPERGGAVDADVLAQVLGHLGLQLLGLLGGLGALEQLAGGDLDRSRRRSSRARRCGRC